MKKLVNIIRVAIIVGAVTLAVYMVSDQINDRQNLRDIPELVQTNEHSGTYTGEGDDEEVDDNF